MPSVLEAFHDDQGGVVLERCPVGVSVDRSQDFLTGSICGRLFERRYDGCQPIDPELLLVRIFGLGQCRSVIRKEPQAGVSGHRDGGGQ